jgi:hypothetical protein
MAKQIYQAKEEMLADLQAVLYTTIHEFGGVYMGRGELAYVDGNGAILNRFRGWEAKAAQELDISEMIGTRYMSMIFDYVIDGRLDTQLSNNWVVAEEDIEGFFEGLRDFPLIDANANHFPIEPLLLLLDVMRARKLLDNGGFVRGDDGDVELNHMHLREVALLAGIDEKTARNLAHPRAKNRLVTRNWNGRTLVEIPFAREWLKQRGFKETVEFDSMLERDLDTGGFWSLRDLGSFVRGHRERKGWTLTELASRIGQGVDDEPWIESIENASATFDKTRMASLANALELPVKPFTVAALKVIQEAELERIKSELV